MSIGFPYDNEELANEIYNRVCAIGFLEAPEMGAFVRCGPFGDTEFGISMDLDDECEPIVEQFKASAIEDQLPYELADRDFEEKYGKMEPLEVVNNSKLLKELEAIQKKYKQEFERYGVIHLRLEERKP